MHSSIGFNKKRKKKQLSTIENTKMVKLGTETHIYIYILSMRKSYFRELQILKHAQVVNEKKKKTEEIKY